MLPEASPVSPEEGALSGEPMWTPRPAPTLRNRLPIEVSWRKPLPASAHWVRTGPPETDETGSEVTILRPRIPLDTGSSSSSPSPALRKVGRDSLVRLLRKLLKLERLARRDRLPEAVVPRLEPERYPPLLMELRRLTKGRWLRPRDAVREVIRRGEREMRWTTGRRARETEPRRETPRELPRPRASTASEKVSTRARAAMTYFITPLAYTR